MPTALHTAKILIVEDEYLTALDEQSRLSAMGYENVILVESSELALDRIRQESPDLVLLGINHSGGRGCVEAARLIRKECGIPIVFVSACSAEQAGARDGDLFLRKPFMDGAFRRAILSALR